MTVVRVAVVALVASADCLLLEQSILVLRVRPQAPPLALALGCHLKAARLSVSRQPQEVTASPPPLPEPTLVSPPPVLVVRC